MTEEEFNAIKARLQASTAREQSPAGRAFRRFATEWIDGTAGHPRNPRPAASPRTATPRTQQPDEREQLLADGLVFSVQAQDREQAEADHRARQRRATEAREQQQRTWSHIRDAQGMDAADAWLRGQA